MAQKRLKIEKIIKKKALKKGLIKKVS